MGNTNLLDELSMLVGCASLSDLRNEDKKQSIIDVISQIESETFSIKDWNDAFEYIFCQKSEKISANEIKGLFVNRLSQ